jgi:hypothetical protein
MPSPLEMTEMWPCCGQEQTRAVTVPSLCVASSVGLCHLGAFCHVLKGRSLHLLGWRLLWRYFPLPNKGNVKSTFTTFPPCP